VGRWRRRRLRDDRGDHTDRDRRREPVAMTADGCQSPPLGKVICAGSRPDLISMVCAGTVLLSSHLSDTACGPAAMTTGRSTEMLPFLRSLLSTTTQQEMNCGASATPSLPGAGIEMVPDFSVGIRKCNEY